MSIRMFRCGLFLLGLCLLTTNLSAQEWTRFRGPNGSGVVEKISFPTTWTESDIAWKTALPAKGHSSPVIWGDKIFLTGAENESGQRMVFCVDTAGKVLWTKKFPASTHRIHTQNSYASGTPSVDADAVYAAWATPENGMLVALTHTGEEKWRYELPGYVSRHGFGSSPLLIDDLVVITNDQDGPSSVIAVDRVKGQLRWKVDRKVKDEQNASYATPLIYQPDAKEPKQLVIASWGHGVSSLNPANGATIWEKAVFPRRPVGSPILHAGLIIGNCGEGAGDNSVIAVRPTAKGEPQTQFTIDKSMAPYVPSVIAKDNMLFLWTDKGLVSCLELPSGKPIWDKKRTEGNFSSSPVIAGDQLINISAKGEVFILSATKEFKILGRNKLDEDTRATPAIAGGKLFLRTEGHLFAINSKK